ncbi:hypothetical protein LTR49_028874, partial [Elasticomyces elasticus]
RKGREAGTLWLFTTGVALYRMKAKLYDRLSLNENARVLEAGAGFGLAAVYIADSRLRVHAVDLTPAYVQQASGILKSHGLQDRAAIALGDQHNLSDLTDGSFDEIYTMETFVHADNTVK